MIRQRFNQAFIFLFFISLIYSCKNKCEKVHELIDIKKTTEYLNNSFHIYKDTRE